METTVTNLPEHKGAFAQTMRAARSTTRPDITADQPEWREVFDVTTRRTAIVDPDSDSTAAAATAAGSRPASTTSTCTTRSSAAARARSAPTTPARRQYGPDARHPEAASPPAPARAAASTRSTRSPTAAPRPTARRCRASTPWHGSRGGPHWGALDNFELGDGRVLPRDHRRDAARGVELLRRPHRPRRRPPGLHRRPRPRTATLTLDTEFKDEFTGRPCIDFNRDDLAARRLGSGEAALHAVRHGRRRHPVTRLSRGSGWPPSLALLLTGGAGVRRP